MRASVLSQIGGTYGWSVALDSSLKLDTWVSDVLSLSQEDDALWMRGGAECHGYPDPLYANEARNWIGCDCYDSSICLNETHYAFDRT